MQKVSEGKNTQKVAKGELTKRRTNLHLIGGVRGQAEATKKAGIKPLPENALTRKMKKA